MFYSKTARFFKFHGAPDITITDVRGSTLFSLLSVDDDQPSSSAPPSSSDDENSQDTDVAILENAIKIKAQKSAVLEKVGELLSNTHAHYAT